MGHGYTFNANKFEKMYKETEYNVLFERIMSPSIYGETRFPESSGPDYRLRLVLNGDFEAVKQYEKNPNDYTKAITQFTLGVHDPSFPANLRGESVKVRTGYETTIMITPKVLFSTSEAVTASARKAQNQVS